MTADLTEANELVRKQKFPEAEALLAEMQAEFPDDARLLTMRGELLVALGKPKEAIPLLQRVTELEPEIPQVAAVSAAGTPDGQHLESVAAAEIQFPERFPRQLTSRRQGDLGVGRLGVISGPLEHRGFLHQLPKDFEIVRTLRFGPLKQTREY